MIEEIMLEENYEKLGKIKYKVYRIENDVRNFFNKNIALSCLLIEKFLKRSITINFKLNEHIVLSLYDNTTKISLIFKNEYDLFKSKLPSDLKLIIIKKYDEDYILDKLKEFTSRKRKLEQYKNLCIECGIDLGETNPRQYCGKTYCYNS